MDDSKEKESFGHSKEAAHMNRQQLTVCTSSVVQAQARKQPNMEREDRSQVSALAEELLTMDSYRERKSQFSLKRFPWWVYHTPVQGHTSKNMWVVQMNLTC